MSTATNNTVREITGTEVGEFVVGFAKVQQELDNGSKRCTVVIEKDEKDAQPMAVTLWLNKGETKPAPKSVIHAFIERSRVTNTSNGKQYDNADVRTWTFSE